MNDEQSKTSSEQSEQSGQGEKPKKSLGKILASAREEQGLSQQQVADRLHLRLSSVQAMETDSIEQGVSSTFTKGYVRLYARLLGLKPEPLLRMFDKLHVQDTHPAKLQSFSRRVAREANDSRWNMVSYVIAILVLGSVVVWWVDYSNFSLSDSFNEEAGVSSQSEEGVIDLETSTQDLLNNNEQEQVSSAQEQLASPDEIEDGSVISDSNLTITNEPEQNQVKEQAGDDPALNQNADAAFDGVITQGSDMLENVEDELDTDAPDLQSTNDDTLESQNIEDADNSSDAVALALDFAQNNETAYQINADGTVDMTFTFAEDCWVSVKDAFDETIAIGVKVKGRVMEVSGVPPISIILGAPQVVEIDFGGENIDMSRFDDGRSANFQLPLQGD